MSPTVDSNNPNVTVTQVVQKVSVSPVPVQITEVTTPISVDIASPGPEGPPGPAGPAGGATFEEFFNSPSNSWVVNHNLQRYPVPVVFVSGVAVTADVSYGSENQLTVTFLSPQTGKVEI
jgi:hypothetical protein